MSFCPIVGDDKFDHLVKLVHARYLSYKSIFFPL